MNAVQSYIFHLVRAKIVLRKTLAFCGLMAILLTASCGQTPSDPGTVPTPQFSEEEGSEPGGAIEVQAEKLPETKPETQIIADTEPEPVATHEVSNSDSEITVPSASTTMQARPVVAPTEDDVRSVEKRLNSNFIWAMSPTFVDIYKDVTGQVREHFKVSPGNSQELKDLLAKMRNDLVARGGTADRVQFEIKEQGSCAAATCDSKAPICISLEDIQGSTAKDKLEQTIRPLIMREFARQHCADESMANQVENYYKLPAIQNSALVDKTVSSFTRVRVSLTYLKSALNAGAKKESKEEICNVIKQGASAARVLQDQVIQSGFVKDPKSPAVSSRLQLVRNIEGMAAFCSTESLDTPSMVEPLQKALVYYDHLAQEFSKNSGMIVIDFTKHQWAH
ncbi:hypothetical protein D3C87_1202970 [compost metagenome]